MKKFILILVLLSIFLLNQCKNTSSDESIYSISGDWRITVTYTTNTCNLPPLPNETIFLHIDQNGGTISGETDDSYGIVGTIDNNGNFTLSYSWDDEDLHYKVEASGKVNDNKMTGSGSLSVKGTEDGITYDCQYNFTFTGDKWEEE